ncbi:MAG: peptidoglycan DD-metalloendopeptidase family protein [Bacteroidia bacterium]|nr:peptidoglycan DD-metalloendopeptidase family protein [Bacteroidia bacterium]
MRFIVKSPEMKALLPSLLLLLAVALSLGPEPVAFGSGGNASKKKKELEEKKKKLQQEIEYKKKLLDEVKGNKSRSMLLLAIINNKMKDQEDLIQTLNAELNELGVLIDQKKTEIRHAEDDLARLKAEYARMVISAYKGRNANDKLLFLFASEDFGQAYKRLKYFEVYTHHRALRAKELAGQRDALRERMLELENKKSEQHSLLGQSEDEKRSLGKQKDEKETLIGDLKKKEKELKDEVKKKKEMADKIKKQIDKLIEEEIRKYATREPDPKADPKKKTPKIKLTPEEELVNTGFEGNRGKLPWPVKEGVIVQHFGTYLHPELKNIELNSNGVDITTNKGAGVRAVYDGEVVVAGSLGAVAGKVVIIKHGEYFTVYQGLEELNVKKGDKVKTKQQIGIVIINDNNESELHFEIYRGKSLQDPEHWISRA